MLAAVGFMTDQLLSLAEHVIGFWICSGCLKSEILTFYWSGPCVMFYFNFRISINFVPQLLSGLDLVINLSLAIGDKLTFPSLSETDRP